MKIKRYILLSFLIFINIQISYSQTGYIEGTPRLAFWELGNGNESIIVLHGGPATEHSYLRPEWDTLSYISNVFYYDQRGCGKSDSSQSYTWVDHIQDLKRLINSVSKNDKVILAGSSWGSELALLYSIYYPEDLKALILSGFCEWTGINPKKIDFNNYSIDSLYFFKREEVISNFEDSIRDSKIIYYNDFNKRLRENDNPEKDLKTRMTTNWNTWAKTKASRASAPDINYLIKINVPILVFGGNIPCAYQDWSDVIEVLNDNTKRVVINNSCHDPWYTHPNEFFQECFNFIQDINDN